MINIYTIISVITGILLTISELLPFIKSLESQGIIHFLVNIGQKLLASNPELQPLLDTLNIVSQSEQHEQHEQNEQRNNKETSINIYELIDNINSNIDNKMNVLNSGINTMTSNINIVSTNVNYISEILKDINNDFKTARQLKLQTSELYQLNYIINYIKQNYIKRQLKFKNLSKNNKELLSSEGYIINYDSLDDTSVVSW